MVRHGRAGYFTVGLGEELWRGMVWQGRFTAGFGKELGQD